MPLPAALALLAAVGACGGETPALDMAALRDPMRCRSCHPTQFREWSGSMHAYASKDPLFLAMNARGQRETGGALGDFCVSCHAPMAVLTGATSDGLNLASLPDHLQGVTCYFCHSVEGIEGTHNAALRLASDGVMRAGIAAPVSNSAHRSTYSPLHDRNRIESADLCGVCHDIVTPAGVPLERTFAEWKASLFAHQKPTEQLTCNACHMPGSDGLAAEVPGAPTRRVHGHAFPGVDVALTEFPETEAQRAGVQRDLDTTLFAQVCVADRPSGPEVDVILQNVAAGHSWPSGAAQDRRAWVEVRVWRNDAEIYRSGVVAAGEPVTSGADPDLWLLRDRVFDDADREVHMFWDVRRVESDLLPAPTERSLAEPGFIDTHITRSYRLPLAPGQLPDRITVKVHIRPVGLDVVDDLIATGDLDAVFRERIPTFTLAATQLEWRREADQSCVPVVR